MAARPQSTRVTKQAAREAGARNAMCLAPHHVPTGIATVVTPGLTARCVTLPPKNPTQTGNPHQSGFYRRRLESRASKRFPAVGMFETRAEPELCVAFGDAMPFGSNSHICPQERVRRVIFLSLRAQQSRRPCDRRRNTTRLPRRLRLLAMTSPCYTPGIALGCCIAMAGKSRPPVGP